MNKSLLTNLVAIGLILFSYTFEGTLSTVLLFTGLFALSGAITNQIAIHMLFEKVPLLYGSGVIELRFEAFKNSIKSLMMEQFFTKEQFEQFFQDEKNKLDLGPIIEKTDFSPAYEALKKTVMESPFGGMLGMFGGESALDGLKDSFVQKLKNAVFGITQTSAFEQTLSQNLQSSSLSVDMLDKVEFLIDQRLDELTPKMVKQIVQDFIKEHLGWLVVWGGFFGGVIGFVSSLVL